MHQGYLLKGLDRSPHVALPAASARLLPLVGKYPESFAALCPDSATRLRQGERWFVQLRHCVSARLSKHAGALGATFQVTASSAFASICWSLSDPSAVLPALPFISVYENKYPASFLCLSISSQGRALRSSFRKELGISGLTL